MAASIFRNTIGELAGLLTEALIDHDSFERPMAVCELVRCRATCCHDGVILSQEEAKLLGDFGDGIEELPDGRWKTRTVPAAPELLAEDFAAHFPKTRCVFLDEQHRCRWQLKAVEEKRHPWFYKPVSCWMHPLLLKNENGRPVLTVLSGEEDQERFASETPCGRVAGSGVPAGQALRAELEMLGEISGRDLYGELNGPPGFSAAKDITSG